MVRELVVVLLVFAVGGCSLLLDFSDQAVPRDASPDAPFDAADCAYKEFDDSLAAAAAIALSDTGPAAICSGVIEDHDFYRFTVPAAVTRVEIRVGYVVRPGGDLDLRLYDAG